MTLLVEFIYCISDINIFLCWLYQFKILFPTRKLIEIGAKNPSKSIEISKTFDFYFRHRRFREIISDWVVVHSLVNFELQSVLILLNRSSRINFHFSYIYLFIWMSAYSMSKSTYFSLFLMLVHLGIFTLYCHRLKGCNRFIVFLWFSECSLFTKRLVYIYGSINKNQSVSRLHSKTQKKNVAIF